MATSGTVAQTVISTAKVLEHALRRAGVTASAQTPDVVDVAKECLYLLLSHYANTSLNLWCIEKVLVPLTEGKAEYSLPSGTNDVLNVHLCTPMLAEAASFADNLLTLGSATSVVRVGVVFTVLPTTDFDIELASDGAVFFKALTVKAFNAMLGLNWYDLPVFLTGSQVRVSAGTASMLYAATSVSEIPVTPLNRDQYADLPNKTSMSAVPVNYLFSKTLAPSITLWQVPADSIKHLALYVHRQVQDVGSLTQTLAIPSRWFEATIIQLAFRLSMELPGIDAERIKMLLDLSEKFKIESTEGETDSAPIYISPGISAYTR